MFEDFPRVKDLGNASFPRIGVTILTEASDPLGIYDDNQKERITFQIDVVAKKDKIYDITTTDEAIGTMASTANSNRLTYTLWPTTVTNIKHGGAAYTNVVERSTVSAFTTLTSGTVEWASSTGDLNFSAADIASHNTQAITSTSVTAMGDKKLCQYLAREIIKAIKNNWRTDVTINGLHDPIKISNNPVPIDEDLGIYRQIVEYQFDSFNSGEGIN